MRRFNHGDKVRLVGRDNPFAGEAGSFSEYETEKVEKERLIVILDSDKSVHYFYEDEVKSVVR